MSAPNLLEPVQVSVKLGAANNVARCGIGKSAKIANSTSDGRTAAIRAAAKFFRCAEREIVLTGVQKGDCCANKPEIYIARRPGHVNCRCSDVVAITDSRIEAAFAACRLICFAVKNAARFRGEFNLNDILAANRLAAEALGPEDAKGGAW